MRQFAVIGLGRFGSVVAEKLAEKGANVIAIDKNEEVVKKLKDREDIFIVSLAGILACTGLAQLLGLSLILACMVLGMAFINMLPRIGKTVHDLIREVMPPIYVIFFIVAGMGLRFDLLLTMGTLGIVYIICRTVGLIGGAHFSARVSGAPRVLQKYLGFGILCQAGVAIGLATLAAAELSAFGVVGQNLGTLAITMIAATTVVFEIIGPIGVRYAISKAGEMGRE